MAARYRDDPEILSTRWITLGQACKLLGVNESTLRRWADAGHVRSFRTPGGHRRFSEDDLRALLAGQRGPGREPYNSVSEMALTRIRRRLQRGHSQTAPWYSGLRQEERDRLRPLGRRLVVLVSEYLTKGAQRTRLAEEAREIGHEYGRELAGNGLSLFDALEAFIFFRKSLDETAMEVAQKSDLSAEETIEMWELLSNLADQVLLAMAETYERIAASPDTATAARPA